MLVARGRRVATWEVMLKSIRLQNWKGHQDTEVPLEKLTVLVGPNGTGKSTVLDAVQQLGAVAAGRTIGQVFTGRHAPTFLRSFGSTGTTSVVLEGVVAGRRFSASTSFAFPPGPLAGGTTQEQVFAKAETEATYSVDGQPPQRSPGGFGSEEPTGLGEDGPVFWRSWVRSAAWYRLNAPVIAAPASSQQSMPAVLFDGRDTAVVLKALKLGYDDRWVTIVERVRRVVENVVSIGVEQIPRDEYAVPSPSSADTKASGEWYRIFFDFKGAKRVPAFAASEGTLVTLALITILSAPNHPNLILLDDIEQGLHPTAQMELVRQLRALLDLEDMRDVQIIATTHSPYILDPLDLDQVCVFALRPDGSAAVKRLSEHPDADRLRGTVTAGELWSSDPEHSWVVGE